jgi:hypothetical protein
MQHLPFVANSLEYQRTSAENVYVMDFPAADESKISPQNLRAKIREKL